MRYRRALPSVIVLALILYIGLRSERLPEAFAGQDKLHHALGFAALVVTLRLAFPARRVLGLIAASLAAALLIELGQVLQPDRSPSAADMLANAVGVALGWLCVGTRRGAHPPPR